MKRTKIITLVALGSAFGLMIGCGQKEETMPTPPAAVAAPEPAPVAVPAPAVVATPEVTPAATANIDQASLEK